MPGLPTSSRSLATPSSSAVAATAARTVIICPSGSAAARAPPLTPVGARYSPKTSRSAKDHSPVVTPARAQARLAAIRLTPSWAASALSRSSAASTAVSSRCSRHCPRLATISCSAAGSTCWTAASRSAVSGLGSLVVKQLTPTTLSAPDSILACRAACEATSRALR